MDGKKLVLGVIAVPAFLLVLVLVLVMALGGSESTSTTSFRSTALGESDLNTAAVPSWAVQPLLSAAQTCPDITAPLLAAQIETESDWNPDAYNPNSQATGLAQFIPSTWKKYGVDADHNGTADPRNPDDAIATQAVYMCDLVQFVQNSSGLTGDTVDLALAAYNAGPANVTKYKGIPPFPETTNYVTKIRNLANTTYSLPTGVLADASGQAQQVIQAAEKYVTTPTMYAWGGGTLDGPSKGSGSDAGVIGFDCSGLARYAYYQGSGQSITLPRTAQDQYDATKSQPVAVSALAPGDLMFWGIGHIHHVAIYIGNGQMVEAPQSGQFLHVTSIRTNGDYAGATRVFGGPLDPHAHAT
jgi:cell wall-associated NlpC family hydrolase